jgi:cyclophilin family peptidyl-prolyl cis-trans isomerase
MTTCTRRSLIAVIATGALITLTACGSSGSKSTTSATAADPATQTDPTAQSTGCSTTPPNPPAAPKTYRAPPKMTISAAKTYTATMSTSCGTIVIRLEPKLAPVTVNSFVFLADQGFYNGLTFHRVIPGFVIQGGDPKGDGTGGPGYQFKDELPTTPYTLGDLAMANAGPNTNGSQFFIVEGAQGTQLPYQYSRFGHVTSGFPVVVKIANVPSSATTNKPNSPVWIYSVKIAVGS